VPLRAVAEAFGAAVYWDDYSKTVKIEYLTDDYLIGAWRGTGFSDIITSQKNAMYHDFYFTFTDDGNIDCVEQINYWYHHYKGTYELDVVNARLFIKFLSYQEKFDIYNEEYNEESEIICNFGYSIEFDEYANMLFKHSYIGNGDYPFNFISMIISLSRVNVQDLATGTFEYLLN